MPPTDEKLQHLISATLRGGVLVAASIGLIGGALYLLSSPPVVAFGTFHGAATPFASPSEVLRLALTSQAEDPHARGLAIAQLGILCLLLTPILRVAFSIFGFVLERDRVYVLITTAVLLTLTGSILLH
ncbi:DUF1634 domain-containing protein [uncultured Paludibaculum sp.]|uniref:DUF1634 domain-containing protein n=1 Tax=uncultured Paludibaculum sp. TaxID=1765020 RepID=UPI002AAB1FA1|nr:DUF1634 domain-containing protein [uncultured Paludibaculum sp.]